MTINESSVSKAASGWRSLPPEHHWRRARLRRPHRVLLLLSVLTTVVSVALPTSGALAARPSGPSTAPDHITLDVDGLDLPDASGSPKLLVSAAEDFAVTVTFRAGDAAVPYSDRTDTEVLLTVSDGSTLTTATVPAGESSVTIPALWLPAANGVTLTAQALGRKPASDLAPGTAGPFDVVLTADTVVVPEDQRGTNLFVNVAGSAEPCQATPDQQTCVDVVLPNGVNSNVFFSTGLCTGDIGCRDVNGIVLQVLADLGARYTADSPATLIVRCDKTRCGGGAIKDNTLQVNLDPVGDLAPSPACGAKGFMDGPDGHCVDYVQSKRDGSGDTYLYLLITRDARMSF